MIKFISYDGKWPCLCFGTLKIEVDGKEYSLKGILHSGGQILGGPPDWDFEIETGEWSISEDDLPQEIRKYRKEIEDLVNSNVEYGCCGGCI